jgi:VanZ family protein
MNANTSSSKSKGVREFVNSIIAKLGFDFEITEHFARKAAHFFEFFLLGIFLTLILIAFDLVVHKNITIPLFIGLLVAVLDEYIQLYVEGRAGMVSDVVLDFSGLATGVIIVLAITIIKKKASQRKPLD